MRSQSTPPLYRKKSVVAPVVPPGTSGVAPSGGRGTRKLGALKEDVANTVEVLLAKAKDLNPKLGIVTAYCDVDAEHSAFEGALTSTHYTTGDTKNNLVATMEDNPCT